MQLFVRTLEDTTLAVDFAGSTVDDFKHQLSPLLGIPAEIFSLELCGGVRRLQSGLLQDQLDDCAFLHVKLMVCGGIDFQHREGSKIGSGGQQSESQAALERKERLRKLALETIDITKDPYIIRNNLGTFECKLCLTVHPNEGNYLAHTQGKRHQYNLGRRAAMEAKNATAPRAIAKETVRRNVIRIGRPGYKVTKSRDQTMQRSLTFEVDYPEAEEGCQPRHRFMSAFEQKVEAADKNYQYVLFACDPYETIGFKIPNQPIDKREGKFFTNWDTNSRKFVLQLYFLDEN
ncbi:hypothetical protein B484DRAFT_458417 [Ochromonadaceae sp. CCMP2298]|nr:hypothetical protein B484DRAFT_458417 [Ochromonadaceae sp. CCMP2298]